MRDLCLAIGKYLIFSIVILILKVMSPEIILRNSEVHLQKTLEGGLEN